MDAATRTGGISAVVEYDYIAKEADELDLVKGAIIHGIRQMPGGWWEGTMQSGKTGMFPDNFVRVIGATSDDNAVILREKSATSNRRCKVIYSYSQVNEDELSLGVGDVIEFLGEVEEGWWRGRLKTKVGVFPSNFVVEIEPSPILASKRPPTITAPITITAAAAPAPALAPATTTQKTIFASNNSAATTSTSNTTTTTSATSSAATAAATTATTTTITKKTNRLSFHSSKEDLLSNSSTTISSSSTLAADDAAAAAAAAPSLPPKPQREFCRVEFPYAPQNDDELELKVGDIITVVNMELPDKGWWKGELRGKIGVFPDNFVKLLAPSEVSPPNETQSQQTHRTAKKSNLTNAAASSTTNYFQSTTNISAPATSTTTNSFASTNNSSKILIKKTGSTSSTQSSNRKDSFGSRDSLNDILSETGLPSGNVAAQRKSLENKNLDLSNAPDASTRLGLKKPQPLQLQQQEIKTITNNNNTTILSSSSLNNTSTGELRKSIENMDEKTKTPPPVLTKKPLVPTKKTSTVTSVAGNLLSGLKQKVKNVENKLTTTASQDCGDGVGSSRLSSGSGLPDAAPSGHVVMRRAATIAGEDTEFDRVERASILSDMRAGRVKAPKRRPPSAAVNVIGESNNNNTVYLNGSGGSAILTDEDANNKTFGSDDNSTGEEQLAQPKTRQWEKKKAPWMEELKASQEKKKTSPSLEPRTIAVTERKISSSSSNNSASTSVISSTATSAATTAINSSTSSSSTTTKVQSSSVSSSVMQQSLKVESSSSSSEHKKELNISNSSTNSTMPDSMAKSMSGTSTASLNADDVRATRPNSLALLNRSISPSVSGGRKTSATNAPHSVAAEVVSNSAATTQNVSAISSTAAKMTTTAATSTTIVNNHHVHSSTKPAHEHTNNIPNVAADAKRVIELERRVEKLETVVHTQQRTIEELARLLREETDRVKLLRGELDKYAQCVTQV